MSKLIDLQAQIDKLQKQAEELRTKEFNQTVIDIKKLMNVYGISVKDLREIKTVSQGKKLPKSHRKVHSVKKDRVPVLPKYAGPRGESWTGRGLTPKWLTTLIESGHAKESFLIKTEHR